MVILLRGQAFPDEKVIFRAGAAIGEGTDAGIFPGLDSVALALAEGPFYRAAARQKLPFLAFRAVREYANPLCALVGFPQFQFIPHFLAIEGSWVGDTDERVFFSIGVFRSWSRSRVAY